MIETIRQKLAAVDGAVESLERTLIESNLRLGDLRIKRETLVELLEDVPEAPEGTLPVERKPSPKRTLGASASPAVDSVVDLLKHGVPLAFKDIRAAINDQGLTLDQYELRKIMLAGPFRMIRPGVWKLADDQ